MVVSFLKTALRKSPIAYFLARKIVPEGKDAKTQRQEIFNALIKDCALTELRGVEIGPFDRPSLPKDDFPRVEYADVFTTDQLRERARNNPRRKRSDVCEVDHVMLDKSFSDLFSANELDFILCSHVLEHVPDFLGYLRDVENVLRPGGRMIIAYPDRRYTFDLLRAPSSFEALVDRFNRKVTRPDPDVVYDYLINHRRVYTGRIWSGIEPKHDGPSFSEEFALKRMKEAETTYVDAHCNIFTDTEFVDMIKTLNQEGLVSLKVNRLIKTRRPLNEFFVVLEK